MAADLAEGSSSFLSSKKRVVSAMSGLCVCVCSHCTVGVCVGG